jgi:GMP synthase (glutamine-hydrolysing)
MITSRNGNRERHALRVALLEHVPEGPLDAYGELLRARGAQITRVHPAAGDRLPDWPDFDAIVAMGGLANALDDATHPWLAAERAWIREAVSADKPFWGVCLGAQLLACALSGSVRRGPMPEVGIRRIEVLHDAAADPVFGGVGPMFEALEWHHDTFELPAGASLLASSFQYRHQAFVWRRAYGVQFHLEATPEVVRHWAHKPEFAASTRPDELETVLRELDGRFRQTTRLAKRLLGLWLDQVVEPTP